MHQDLTVSTCVTVRSGCPIRCHVNSDGWAEFSLGGPRDGFDFVFEPAALRELVKHGVQALSDIDLLALQDAVRR